MTDGELIFGQSLVAWLSTYGYFIMIPLIMIEGPAVAITAGFMAALGIFNPIVVFFVFTGAELLTDTIFFFSARRSHSFLLKLKIYRNIIDKLENGTDNKTVRMVEFFRKHITKIMFFVKVLPIPNLPKTTVIAAGALKVDTKKFYIGDVLGQPIWSAMTIGLGYYLGSTALGFLKKISITSILILVFIILSLISFRIINSYILKKTPVGEILGSGKK